MVVQNSTVSYVTGMAWYGVLCYGGAGQHRLGQGMKIWQHMVHCMVCYGHGMVWYRILWWGRAARARAKHVMVRQETATHGYKFQGSGMLGMVRYYAEAKHGRCGEGDA